VAENDAPAEERFVYEWLSTLLAALDANLPTETKAAILQGCAAAHYRSINMDELVSQYRGNVEGFLQLLSEKWQWKVIYDKEAQIITADENKSVCVCPLVQKGLGTASPALCHCSEGFAERMFSAVAERPVKAQVTRSILRGDKSCVYTIQLL
jgi:predicted hydrocarbon binding protein